MRGQSDARPLGDVHLCLGLHLAQPLGASSCASHPQQATKPQTFLYQDPRTISILSWRNTRDPPPHPAPLHNICSSSKL